MMVTILLPFTIESVKVRRFGLAGDTHYGTRPEGLEGNGGCRLPSQQCSADMLTRSYVCQRSRSYP